MSGSNSILPVASRTSTPVENAIARAANKTGIEFGFLLAQAKVESALDTDAKARTSSATGLFQFIESTWLDVLRRHGGAHGYGTYAQAIQAGPQGPKVPDPALRREILALRKDPQAASLMAGALAQDNRDALMPVLGREPDAGELYLAHFLGSGGASRFLTALADRPGASAAAEFAKPARANRPIFYTQSGQPRSFSGVMDLLRAKIENAMPSDGRAQAITATVAATDTRFSAEQRSWSVPATGSAPFGRQVSAREPITQPPQTMLPKLSDLLHSSFAAGAGGHANAAGDHARRAYERLKAFGL